MKLKACTLVLGLLISGAMNLPVHAAVVFTFDSSAHVGGNASADAGLPVSASSTDLLNGIAPTSTATVDILAGGAAGFSDGLVGEQDFAPNGRGLFLGNSGSIVDFTGLPSVDVGELRVFSHNPDIRTLQGYSVSFDTGSGFGAPTIAVDGGLTNAANVSRVFDDTGALLASGVVGIRFAFTDIFADAGDHHGRVLNEIDAFAASPVPEPSTLMLGSLGLIALGAYGWRRKRA